MAKQDTFQKWVEEGEADSMLAIIQSLSMQGFSQKEIAKEIGTTDRTFRRMLEKYASVKSALKSGRRTVVAMLQNKLMDRVQSGDTTAIIYALKIYGGEFFNTDRVKLSAEVTGRNGQPIDLTGGVHVYLPMKDDVGNDKE